MKAIKSLVLASMMLLSGSVLNASLLIPDGSIIGVEDSQTYSFGDGALVSGLSVHLNISGGRIGDLYVYLSHGSEIAVLLNRVGMAEVAGGYSYAGLNVTFADGSFDIHTVSSPTSGLTYEADGRDVSPFSVTTSSPRNENPFSVFLGDSANGEWSLFLADVNGNGSAATLESWEITAVPEPANIALGIFAAGLLAFSGACAWKKKLKTEKLKS